MVLGPIESLVRKVVRGAVSDRSAKALEYGMLKAFGRLAARQAGYWVQAGPKVARQVVPFDRHSAAVLARPRLAGSEPLRQVGLVEVGLVVVR